MAELSSLIAPRAPNKIEKHCCFFIQDAPFLAILWPGGTSDMRCLLSRLSTLRVDI
jgi:hypothetical protein